MTTSHNRSAVRGLPAVLVALALTAAGCQHWGNGSVRQAPDTAAALTLNSQENGAAVVITHEAAPAEPTLPRTLAFEIIGRSPRPTADATADDRVAAVQAAIIDALSSAVVEARRARGQSVTDFTANMGPRLTLTRKEVDRGTEIRVSLVTAGAETAFTVRNGKLMHPPQDWQAVRQVFEATNGEYTLLSTRSDETTGLCTARVGCYVPGGESNSAVVGDLRSLSSTEP